MNWRLNPNSTLLTEHEWAALKAEENALQANPQLDTSEEGFRAFVDFDGRHNGTDRLGIARSFLEICLERGYPWVATKTSFVLLAMLSITPATIEKTV